MITEFGDCAPAQSNRLRFAEGAISRTYGSGEFRCGSASAEGGGAVQIAASSHVLLSAGQALVHTDVDRSLAPIKVRRISFADLGDVLRKGWDDFLAFRDDVIFLCVVYPLAGLVLAYLLSSSSLLPLIVPVFAGFALLGPFAAIWLYQMS